MRYFIFLLFGLLLLFSCKNAPSVSVKKADIKTSLQIDSFTYYPAPKSNRLNQFIFSPVDDQNKIWVAGHPSYELDLITGKWTDLSDKYDLDFKALIKDENSITIDPYSNNVFVKFRNNGVLQINKKTKDYHFYKSASPFATLFPRKENIILSNTDEIYAINRESHEYKKLASIPHDISAYNFYIKGNDTLLINNGEHVFDLKTLQFSTGIKDRTLSYDTPQPTRSLQQVLKTKGGGRSRIILQDTIEWYLNNHFIHYSLDGQKLYEYKNIPANDDKKNHLRNLLFDDQNIYLLFTKGIGIYNRKHIINNGILFNSHRQQHELDLWHSGMQMYADKEVKLVDLIHRIDSLQNLEIESPELRYKISVLHTKLQEPIKIRESLQLQCEEALKNNTLPKKYIYPACYGLMTLYARKNQIAKAASFYDMMKPLDPNITDEVMERRFIPILLNVHRTLDSLNSIDISEDERLFKEAKAKARIVSTLTIFNDSYPDYSEIDKVYKKIIRNNPSSEYADNAAFELIEHKHLYRDVVDIEPVKNWQKWIDTYPQSDLRANAIIKLASYTNANYYEGEKPQPSYLAKVQSLISSIDPSDLKGQKQDSTFYVSLLNEIKLSLFKSHIDIELFPKELLFKIDQPIVFNVRIKNTSAKDFDIDLFAEGTELAIQLYNRNGIIPSDHGNRIMDQIKSVTIPAGGFKDIPINLSKNAKIFKNNGWVEGKYNVQEAGIYFINFRSPLNMIGQQTKFEVIE